MSEQHIRLLPQEQLDLIDHEIYKWQCCAEGCERFTRVRDYGEHPWYRHGRSWKNGFHWFWMCAKHYKIFRQKPPNHGYGFQPNDKVDMVDNLIFDKAVSFIAGGKVHLKDQ